MQQPPELSRAYRALVDTQAVPQAIPDNAQPIQMWNIVWFLRVSKKQSNIMVPENRDPLPGIVLDTESNQVGTSLFLRVTPIAFADPDDVCACTEQVISNRKQIEDMGIDRVEDRRIVRADVVHRIPVWDGFIAPRTYRADGSIPSLPDCLKAPLGEKYIKALEIAKQDSGDVHQLFRGAGGGGRNVSPVYGHGPDSADFDGEHLAL